MIVSTTPSNHREVIRPARHHQDYPMMRSTVLLSAAVLSAITSCVSATASESQYPCQIGCSSADITGPVVGVQFGGFVRADQTGTGLHLRQRARAFVIADPKTEQRLAIVVCDLGSITHELYREVLDRLQNELGDLYSRENVIITATHTHAAPGGYWHAGVGTPFGSPFHKE
jgi:neutral ceramidase